MSKIAREHNIPESIIRKAEKLDLDALSTGGGIDYIVKYFGENQDNSPRVAYLRNYEDAGSPERINAKAWVVIGLNSDWSDSLDITVRTASEGLDLMAQMGPSGAPRR